MSNIISDFFEGVGNIVGGIGGIVGILAFAVALFYGAPFVLAVGIGLAAAAITNALIPKVNVPSLSNLPQKATPRTGTGNYIPVVMGKGIIPGIEIHTEAVSDKKVQSAQTLCILPDNMSYTIDQVWVGEYLINFDVTTPRIIVSAKDASGLLVPDFNYNMIEKHPSPSYVRESIWLKTWGVPVNTPIFTKDISVLAQCTATSKVNPPQFFYELRYQVTASSDLPGVWVRTLLTDARFGIKLSSSFIDSESLSTWDTYCNTQIPYTLNNVETVGKRFSVNGGLETSIGVKGMLDEIGIATQCVIKYLPNKGKIGIVGSNIPTPETALTPIKLNDSNTVQSTVTVNRNKPNNKVNVSFIKQDIVNGVTTRGAQTTETLDLTVGNSEVPRSTSITSNLCAYTHQAKRIAARSLALEQRTLGISLIGSVALAGITAGDLVEYTNKFLGYADKLFIVTEVRGNLTPDSGLTFDLTLREYSAADNIDTVTPITLPSLISLTPSPRFITNFTPAAPTLYNSQQISNGSYSVITTLGNNININAPDALPTNKVIWRYFTSSIVDNDFTKLPAAYNQWVILGSSACVSRQTKEWLSHQLGYLIPLLQRTNL